MFPMYKRAVLSASTIVLAMPFLLCSSVFGQSSASITGIVVDHSGGVVPNAQVRLQRADAERASVATSARGAYAFFGIEPGKYTIVIAAPGFSEAKQEILLRPRQQAQVQVILHPLTMRR